MQDVTCKLVKDIFTSDTMGNQKPTKQETECPIIKVESIYDREYYEANQSGFKPNLRLRISSLNYNQEQELIYMNVRYTIIRVEERVDETILVCERKLGNESNTRKSV